MSILPKFYEMLFSTKVFCTASLCLLFDFVIFGQKNIVKIAARKMVAKLTTALLFWPLVPRPTSGFTIITTGLLLAGWLACLYTLLTILFLKYFQKFKQTIFTIQTSSLFSSVQLEVKARCRYVNLLSILN